MCIYSSVSSEVLNVLKSWNFLFYCHPHIWLFGKDLHSYSTLLKNQEGIKLFLISFLSIIQKWLSYLSLLGMDKKKMNIMCFMLQIWNQNFYAQGLWPGVVSVFLPVVKKAISLPVPRGSTYFCRLVFEWQWDGRIYFISHVKLKFRRI